MLFLRVGVHGLRRARSPSTALPYQISVPSSQSLKRLLLEVSNAGRRRLPSWGTLQGTLHKSGSILENLLFVCAVLYLYQSSELVLFFFTSLLSF